jgi:hypothetical protein
LPPGGEPTSRAARSRCIDEPRSGVERIEVDDQRRCVDLIERVTDGGW